MQTEQNTKKKILSYNSPVILTYAIISLVVLILGYITKGWTTKTFFTVYDGSLLNPLFYLRLFTHAIGHANLAHYVGNFTYILLLGPMLEEKYGSKRLLTMMIFTAGITGVLNVILFNTGLLGASGIVFMLIILSSCSSMKEKKGIPITLIVVAILFIGNELISAFSPDNISQFGHILGGLCGGCFGYFFGKKKELKPY